MHKTVVIPARMEATRFPGKPMVPILGKPMIQWVYERAAQSMANAVMVATDSEEIAGCVRGFGGNVAMTRSDHENGTQRIAEVASSLDTDLIINVQGDEPAIHPNAIDQVIEPLLQGAAMSTLAEPLSDPDQIFNPNVVKVVMDQRGRALYFSRAPIPYFKHAEMKGPDWRPLLSDHPYYRHVGIYGYTKSFLLEYVAEQACALERCEGLEQLRALYMGASIHVVATAYPTIGVDRPEDVRAAEEFLAKEGA